MVKGECELHFVLIKRMSVDITHRPKESESNLEDTSKKSSGENKLSVSNGIMNGIFQSLNH